MRSAPFGLAARTPEQAWQQAIAGAVLTHGHPSGYLSAAALAWIIRLLADGYPLSEAVHSALDRLDQHGPDAAETSAALAAALDLAAAGPLAAETLQSLGGGWTGEEALAIAVYAALVHTRPEGGADTRAALLDSVNHSGDSDSTGAICGNLLGAAHGLHALPAEWVDTVEAGALVLQSADQLAAQAPPHR
jgi:ADP-ribosylglycohydrolase